MREKVANGFMQPYLQSSFLLCAIRYVFCGVSIKCVVLGIYSSRGERKREKQSERDGSIFFLIISNKDK